MYVTQTPTLKHLGIQHQHHLGALYFWKYYFENKQKKNIIIFII